MEPDHDHAAPLAERMGLTAKDFDTDYLVSFVKVIEFQRRGVVHVHALIRLDGRHGEGPATDAADLAAAVQLAARRAHAPNPDRPDRPIRWGAQMEVDPVATDGRRAAANYLAKYATKSTDDAGALDHRLHHGESDALDVSEHLRRLVRTAWYLGGRPELASLNLRAWAHTLGYRGHWLTKSRSWSTTFTALRGARFAWKAGTSVDQELTVAEWEYRGTAHATAGDALLAASAAANRQLVRRTAWEERTAGQEGR